MDTNTENMDMKTLENINDNLIAQMNMITYKLGGASDLDDELIRRIKKESSG